MKRCLFMALIIASLAGCAENHQNPNISAYQPGDDSASCAVLHSNLQIAKNQLASAQHEGNMQTGENIAAGVLGVATLGLGWMALDTGDGHHIDAQNAEARIMRLNALMADKGCR
ncbi:hypothetical protein IEA35_004597 [Salmonella enterica]|nr:hypothetical protein [Salmonella enterica]